MDNYTPSTVNVHPNSVCMFGNYPYQYIDYDLRRSKLLNQCMIISAADKRLYAVNHAACTD